MAIWSKLKGKKNTNLCSQGVAVYSNEDIITVLIADPKTWHLETGPNAESIS